MPIGHKGFIKGDLAINRRGRAPSSDRIKAAADGTDEKPTTFKQAGIKELSLMFRKIRSHNKQAIQILAMIMNKEGASDTVRFNAASKLSEIYISLCKEIYMQHGDELLDQSVEAPEKEPSAVLHLRVVDSKPPEAPEAPKE